jgi:hypothetical protein
MIEALRDITQIFHDISDSFMLSVYGTTNNQKAIDSWDNFPTTYSEIKKYFYKVRSNRKGGDIWTRVRISFKEDREEFLEEARELLADAGASLFWETVQAPNTDRWFFLMGLDPDSDVEFWSHTLKEMICQQARK